MAMLSSLVSAMIYRTQGMTPRALFSLSRVSLRVGNPNVDFLEESTLPPHVKSEIRSIMDNLIQINRSRNLRLPMSAVIKVYDCNWNLIDESIGFNRYVQGGS